MTKHPPADRRCQIYVEVFGHRLLRCANPGTHWVTWGGCSCAPRDPELCEDEYESWECDGQHGPEAEEVAA